MLGRLIAAALLLASPLLPQTAQDIVNQVVRTYASCESYEDEGQATTTYLFSAGQVVVKPFSTAFVRRPSRFRYEYTERFPARDQVSRYLIWMDSNHVKTWWTVQPHTAHPASLNEAILGASGISESTVFVVPSLLLPDLMSNHTFDHLADLRLGKPEVTGGVKTVTIVARSEIGLRRYTYWVGETNHLIRKVEWTDTPSRQYQVRTVVTYSPKLNPVVHASKLVFDPPRSPQRK